MGVTSMADPRGVVLGNVVPGGSTVMIGGRIMVLSTGRERGVVGRGVAWVDPGGDSWCTSS